MKKTYITPAIEQEEVVVEAGIAVSSIYLFDSIQGDKTPEDWEEGNTDWW